MTFPDFVSGLNWGSALGEFHMRVTTIWAPLLAKNCYIIQEMWSSFGLTLGGLTLGAFPGNDCPPSLPGIREEMSKSHWAILQAL